MPHVTSFITAWTTFEASKNILSGPFVPLSDLHSLDSLKSSLIYETMANGHQTDWWDSPHPHVCLSRCAHSVSGHQQGWKDGELCHDVFPNTTPNCPVVVMIALALLHNHHYMSQLSTVKLPSTLEHYKSMIEMEKMGRWGLFFLSLSPSLCLRVAI